MIFGGFSTTREVRQRPGNAEFIATDSPIWRLGRSPARCVAADHGQRRLVVLGECGATDGELSRLATAGLPTDITWRWPGVYVVVEEQPERTVLHTDPAAALPVYATPWQGGWAWSTSARILARLTEAPIDGQRLACSVLAPSVPALSGTRTFFAGIEQLALGSRIELPVDGSRLRVTVRWRPDPVPGEPYHRLRTALTEAVALRVNRAPDLSCDLSGGLDSTSLAVLAAVCLPESHHLNAITIHPEGDESGADLRYARLAAAHHGRIRHHLLPLAAEHLPYTEITAVPPTTEPAPSTLTRARLAWQLDWMRQHLGSRTHMTGDGGDSVLFQPPAHLADLLRHRQWRRTLSESLGWARLRHTSVLPLLRGAATLARTSRRSGLQDLARALAGAGQQGDGRGNVSWFAPLPLPGWATPTARRLLLDAADEAISTADPLPGLDTSLRVLIDEIREVARTAAADAELADAHGTTLHNPFLDPRTIDAVLRTPIAHRPAVHSYKPALGHAMQDLLPGAVARRSTKGSFNADHYAGMRANLPALTALADGHLADLGLLEPTRFRSHLRQAAAGIPMPLAAIEQALSAEAWCHAHHATPSPAWTTQPPEHPHA
ncbi:MULTISPECIES: albusnodin/ikarugamycin family macrolactam cyclase [Streptomyces]|uniref:albusnodin/ikarugamycin family macrolactam cyclase n=1 Tax=Streptomyces TaxID=1883 RepID=UPI00058AE428|nr:albusnodin/ikarugamycin family macrolactam cyclase [Streptomyces sp. SCSIO ZS0520]